MSFTELFNANARAIGMDPRLAWNIMIGTAVVGLVVVLVGIATATTVLTSRKKGVGQRPVVVEEVDSAGQVPGGLQEYLTPT
jgi:hypothetical protein